MYHTIRSFTHVTQYSDTSNGAIHHVLKCIAARRFFFSFFNFTFNQIHSGVALDRFSTSFIHSDDNLQAKNSLLPFSWRWPRGLGCGFLVGRVSNGLGTDDRLGWVWWWEKTTSCGNETLHKIVALEFGVYYAQVFIITVLR